MSTEVSICNMALGHIKSKSTIALLTEEGAEARICKLYYAQARDETLEEFNWPFAKRFALLATVGTVPTGWVYQYAYPTQCLAVRKVLPISRKLKPIPFELAHSDISDSIVILTDEEAAEIEYTKQITNTTLFSALYTSALSYKIASYIAMPLSGKKELRDLALANFEVQISKARASVLNQSEKDEDEDPDWIKARL